MAVPYTFVLLQKILFQVTLLLLVKLLPLCILLILHSSFLLHFTKFLSSPLGQVLATSEPSKATGLCSCLLHYMNWPQGDVIQSNVAFCFLSAMTERACDGAVFICALSYIRGLFFRDCAAYSHREKYGSACLYSMYTVPLMELCPVLLHKAHKHT